MGVCIQTVRGGIAPVQLGFCHSHEHLHINKGQSAQINPALCIDDPERTAVELKVFRRAGGSAVVDAQPVGCGRGAGQLLALSQQSGVHVIASTGFHKRVFYPAGHWIFSYSEAQLTALFCEELQEGMYLDGDTAPPKQRSAIPAGQIKAALDAPGMDEQAQKLFTAAAAAAIETGAPLMVHIEQGADPTALADFLQRRKLDLTQVIFCHMDRAVPELAIHKAMCKRGIFMEYDTIAREKYHSNQREAELICQMVRAGFGGQILLGLDTTRQRLAAYGGHPGLTYLLLEFVPMLRENGLSQQQILSLFCQNPARAFCMRAANGSKNNLVHAQRNEH